MQNNDKIIDRVVRKLVQRGYENIVSFKTRVGHIVSGTRDGESCVVYVLENPDKEILNIIGNVIDFLGIENVFEAESSTFDIYLRKVRLKVDQRPEIVERCRRFMRILSSISEGQWFDHIRSREKLRGRATVELIRIIRVLEELGALEATWRKWGSGQQHTLKIKRRLSKSELLYYLLKLLNIAIELDK
ncbi:MAG: hypothetical protein GXO10_03650 [Crenarchaeota archaeon]|nr:hypothetical protein [Thermoproteota archaeon]